MAAQKIKLQQQRIAKAVTNLVLSYVDDGYRYIHDYSSEDWYIIKMQHKSNRSILWIEATNFGYTVTKDNKTVKSYTIPCEFPIDDVATSIGLKSMP